MTDTPQHRAGYASRDGDTRVIDGNGKVRNLDADARKKLEAEKAAKPSGAKPAGDEASPPQRKKRNPSDADSGE